MALPISVFEHKGTYGKKTKQGNRRKPQKLPPTRYVKARQEATSQTTNAKTQENKGSRKHFNHQKAHRHDKPNMPIIKTFHNKSIFKC
jgi:hypothetical protein